MRYSVIIVAAGSGTRMHLGYNKVYCRMEGKTILEHTMRLFLDDEECREMIIVTNSAQYIKEIDLLEGRIVLVQGGSSRQESVANGLYAVKEEIVMVHDGARPYLSEKELSALKQAMKTEQAACLAVAVKDTIKQIRGDYVLHTPLRETLVAAQTPQAFKTELLFSCMQKAIESGYTGTDDCSLVERFSDARIRLVKGSYANRKITTPEDLF